MRKVTNTEFIYILEGSSSTPWKELSLSKTRMAARGETMFTAGDSVTLTTPAGHVERCAAPAGPTAFDE